MRMSAPVLTRCVRVGSALLFTMRLTVSALFLAAFFTGCGGSVVDVVQVKLNESVTLQCVKQCAGRVEWTSVAGKEIVAQYDQKICKEERGYKLCSEKIRAGDLSLTITSADFRKKGFYTCTCNGITVCFKSLRIESHRVPVEINPSESLLLALPVREPVEVIYNSTDAAGSSSKQICTVDGRSLQCIAEYKQRVSLDCAVRVQEVMQSDGGIYIIKDTKNKEIVQTFSVTVHDEPPSPGGPYSRERTGALVALLIVLVVLLIGESIFIYHQRREIQRLQGNQTAENL